MSNQPCYLGSRRAAWNTGSCRIGGHWLLDHLKDSVSKSSYENLMDISLGFLSCYSFFKKN